MRSTHNPRRTSLSPPIPISELAASTASSEVPQFHEIRPASCDDQVLTRLRSIAHCSLRRSLARRIELDDIVDEAMLRALRLGVHLDLCSMALAKTFIRYASLDLARRDKDARFRSEHQREPTMSRVVTFGDPCLIVDARMDAKVILNSLSESDRAVILLHFSGWDYLRIAAFIGGTASSLRQRVCRRLKKLQLCHLS